MSIFELGGDICRTDILDAALKDADGVFHFAALWLLHCHDYPRSAFDVNVAGTFNVLGACATAWSGSCTLVGVRLWRRRRGADDREPSVQQPEFLRGHEDRRRGDGPRGARPIRARYVGLRYMNVYGARQDYRGAYIAVIMRMLDSIDCGAARRL